jgi:hypothetical protein
MSWHYTKNTESVTQWCNTCGRPTQHAVSAGRLGGCTEHPAPAETKAQQKRREEREHEAKNPTLF